jgi:glucose-1-phosphate thymidylyltransferase
MGCILFEDERDEDRVKLLFHFGSPNDLFLLSLRNFEELKPAFMKIIVPMAGVGKRMRPHTLTVPKPLLPIAGKPIVQRLVEDIASVCKDPIEEIAFVIGDFGEECERKLEAIASDLGAKASIHYQEEALGTAHAVLCAGDRLEGKAVVAFADTLFRSDLQMDEDAEGVIWVKKVEDDPSSFGLVTLDEEGYIADMVEKPEDPPSDLAIIGIYYFRDAAHLKRELQYLVDNDIKEKGEYQLTNALERMKEQGVRFEAGQVDEWLDCGKKDLTVHTNQRVLEFKRDEEMLASDLENRNSIVIPPCYIGKGVILENSVVGPHVSIGEGTEVQESVLRNSIVQTHSKLRGVNLANSMIGNRAVIDEPPKDMSVGDHNVIKGS